MMMRERRSQGPLPMGPWLTFGGLALGEASDVLLEFKMRDIQIIILWINSKLTC